MSKCFQYTKGCNYENPHLSLPDLNKAYTSFMDALKYAWSTVLTQKHASIINGKTIEHQHPLAYVNRLCQGSQLNWAALTEEAYANSMAVKSSHFT